MKNILKGLRKEAVVEKEYLIKQVELALLNKIELYGRTR